MLVVRHRRLLVVSPMTNFGAFARGYLFGMGVWMSWWFVLGVAWIVKQFEVLR